MLLRINKYTSTHIPAGCVWMCMDFPTAYQTCPRHVWYPHFVRAGLSVLCHAEKSDSKSCRTFLAGALGLEPRAYGFGDRRSTN